MPNLSPVTLSDGQPTPTTTVFSPGIQPRENGVQALVASPDGNVLNESKLSFSLRRQANNAGRAIARFSDQFTAPDINSVQQPVDTIVTELNMRVGTQISETQRIEHLGRLRSLLDDASFITWFTKQESFY